MRECYTPGKVRELFSNIRHSRNSYALAVIFAGATLGGLYLGSTSNSAEVTHPITSADAPQSFSPLANEFKLFLPKLYKTGQLNLPIIKRPPVPITPISTIPR